ncbi:hypothetical protein Pcinc_042188 [Petrolisthes cinctipes]|uniref:Uncharacterized protein n=1 Tax=Petrolisthes cinctipes TaxID=88211 RepID=A0AAE1BLS2_PETCI|nr:hypothetical protein Pcinc_042188 [Petrolisthes cinctipes]
MREREHRRMGREPGIGSEDGEGQDGRKGESRAVTPGARKQGSNACIMDDGKPAGRGCVWARVRWPRSRLGAAGAGCGEEGARGEQEEGERENGSRKCKFKKKRRRRRRND